MKNINSASVVSRDWESKLLASSKENIERKWRDSELSRTDPLSLLSDYPRDGTDLLAYRQALADYPSSEDFPNGVRPKPEDFLVTS